MELKSNNRVVAVMQPYLFPYIGYFQLVQASDVFVFYDDVNYIKNGWINRNRILVNGAPNYFTVDLVGASPNKLINEIAYATVVRKILRTIELAYKKAPFFNEVFPLVSEVLNADKGMIWELSGNSITSVCDYLGMAKVFKYAGIEYADSKGMDKADRLIAITKANSSTQYINIEAGRDLYDKEYFSTRGIQLSFLKPQLQQYRQFGDIYEPGLSIIDVLMFNDKGKVIQMLNEFKID